MTRISVFDTEAVRGIRGLTSLTEPGEHDSVGAIVDVPVIGARGDGKTQFIVHAIRTLRAFAPVLDGPEHGYNRDILQVVMNARAPRPEATAPGVVPHYVFRIRPEALLSQVGLAGRLALLARAAGLMFFLAVSLVNAAAVAVVIAWLLGGVDGIGDALARPAVITAGVGLFGLGAALSLALARAAFNRRGFIEIVFWDVAGEHVYSDSAVDYYSFLSALVRARRERSSPARSYAFAPVLICNPMSLGTRAEGSAYARLRQLIPLFASLNEPLARALVAINRWAVVEQVCAPDRDREEVVALVSQSRPDEDGVDDVVDAGDLPPRALPVVKRDVVRAHCMDAEDARDSDVAFSYLRYDAGIQCEFRERSWPAWYGGAGAAEARAGSAGDAGDAGEAGDAGDAGDAGEAGEAGEARPAGDSGLFLLPRGRAGSQERGGEGSAGSPDETRNLVRRGGRQWRAPTSASPDIVIDYIYEDGPGSFKGDVRAAFLRWIAGLAFHSASYGPTRERDSGAVESSEARDGWDGPGPWRRPSTPGSGLAASDAEAGARDAGHSSPSGARDAGYASPAGAQDAGYSSPAGAQDAGYASPAGARLGERARTPADGLTRDLSGAPGGAARDGNRDESVVLLETPIAHSSGTRTDDTPGADPYADPGEDPHDPWKPPGKRRRRRMASYPLSAGEQADTGDSRPLAADTERRPFGVASDVEDLEPAADSDEPLLLGPAPGDGGVRGADTASGDPGVRYPDNDQGPRRSDTAPGFARQAPPSGGRRGEGERSGDGERSGETLRMPGGFGSGGT